MDERRYDRELRRLMERPGLVPGIYNYCDRWCEKCPATQRCLTFLTGELLEPPTDEPEPNYWDRLTKGHDARPKERDPIRRRRKSDPLADAAHEYMFDVWEFLRLSQLALADRGRDLERAGNRADALELQDAIETILWYQTLCAAKLARAFNPDIDLDDPDDARDLDTESIRKAAEEITAHMETLEDGDEDLDEVEAEAERTDTLGSAKVALIGFDRSIDAWGVIGRLASTLSAAAAIFDRQLRSLRSAVEARAPGARSFRREGLDDATLDRPRPRKKK